VKRKDYFPFLICHFSFGHLRVVSKRLTAEVPENFAEGSEIIHSLRSSAFVLLMTTIQNG